jgi:hypothetical protein
MRRAFVLIGGMWLFTSASLVAQTERGIITGTVLDSAGAVVPLTGITVTNSVTGVSSTTHSTEAGTYSVVGLAVGVYTIRAEKEGFKPIIRSGVTVNAASTVRVDLSLEIGSARQVVEVRGASPILKVEDAKITTTISNRMVEDLPLVVGGAVRSPLDLAVLTPEGKNYGTSIALAGSANNLNVAFDSFSVGGGQPRAYGITLDGVTLFGGNSTPNSWLTYNTPPLDAITEFTVDSNGYKAEFGHALGGTMTFSSKSGTNGLHGSAFEFLRNTDLDANYFFNNAHVGGAIPRQIYKQNNFGASVGGPVIIPHLYNGKNKTFFFFAYEGFRNRIGASSLPTTIPTPEMLSGDFSNWVDSSGKQIPIYDPSTTAIDPVTGKYTRKQFPNNFIPPSSWDPLAAKLLQVYQSGPAKLPAPNNGAAPGTVGYVQNNYLITNGTTVSPWNKFAVRIDHNINANNRISGYWGHNRETNEAGPDGPAALPGFYSNFQYQANRADVFRANWTRDLTPTLLNYFYAGVNVWKQQAGNANLDRGNWKNVFCYPNVPDCNKNRLLRRICG